MSDDLTERLRMAVAAYPDASWWAHPDTLAAIRRALVGVEPAPPLLGIVVKANTAVPPGELWRVPEIRHSFIPKLPIGPMSPTHYTWDAATDDRLRHHAPDFPWASRRATVDDFVEDPLDAFGRLLKRLHDSVPNDADNGEGD